MHIIRPSEYQVMSWKNGGGTTTELYSCPRGTPQFDWRVSIANVEKEGPFSTFSGCERHIMVLSGKGMRLKIARQGEVILQPLKPLSFPGEAEVAGGLLGGPVQDFNLIVQREFGQGELRVMNFDPQDIGSDGGPQFFYLLEGACTFGYDDLQPKDSFWLDKGEHLPLKANIKAVVCSLILR